MLPPSTRCLASLTVGLASVLVPLPAGTPGPELDRVADRALRMAAWQVLEATQSRDENGQIAFWTSQPGAIRTHQADGRLSRLYKLYSAPQLVASTVAESLADVPADWASRPAQFVDLNTPHSAPGGGLVYPIVDPSADAEGFSFTLAPSGNPLPMPVQWVYQLRDGTVGFLDPSHRFITPADGHTPAADNPIVARFAFWSDDTTCKININTASEGVFWDTPRCDTTEERAYARFQPAAAEHQRAMGHPAAVCLSSVLFPGKRYHLPGTSSQLASLTLDHAKQLWLLTPGLNDRGSAGGTQLVDPAIAIPPAPITALHDDPSELVADVGLDSEARVRASKGRFFLTARSRAPDHTASGFPRISLWPVDGSVGSSTLGALASGQGPSTSGRFSAFDELSAARSAIRYRGRPSSLNVIQRQNPTFQRAEFSRDFSARNREIFGLLWFQMRSLRVPGPPGGVLAEVFTGKYGATETSDFGCIGFQMVDYVHSANPLDPTLARSNRFAPGDWTGLGTGQVSPLDHSVYDSHSDTWFIATNPHPKGAGRFPTVSEVSLIVVCRAAQAAGGTEVSGRFSSDHVIEANSLAGSGQDVFEYEVALLVEGFTPAHQPSEFVPACSFQLAGGSRSSLGYGPKDPAGYQLAKMSLSGRSLVVTNQSSGTDGQPDGTSATKSPPIAQSVRWGGGMGVSFLSNAIRFKPLLMAVPAGEARPLFQFSGTASEAPHLRLMVFDASGSARGSLSGLDTENLVQSLQVAFPSISGKFPMPTDAGPPLQDRFAQLQQDALTGQGQIVGPRGLVRSGDIVQSLVPVHGDYRLVATSKHAMKGGAQIVATFVAHPDYGKKAQAHSWRESDPQSDAALVGTSTTGGYFASGVMMPAAVAPDYPIPTHSAQLVRSFADFTPTTLSQGALVGGQEVTTTAAVAWSNARLDPLADGFRRGNDDPAVTGDFDNGIARSPDGPYLNAPDPGEARAVFAGGTPYFDHLTEPAVANPGTFSPSRMMPSAVMFGSLPTGVRSNVPWQTLLFRPDPNAGTADAHFGATPPHDHYLLDLFRMPIVEPSTVIDWAHLDQVWTVSDVYSTAGRINLNYQILPFVNIRRATALHALLKAQKLLAIPDNAGPVYKTGASDQPWRHFIDTNETLRQWESKFAAGDCFRHASEICEQWLVPEGESIEHIKAFWASHRLTGDNSKERPYANIYPHLTTRSNTFEVHILAQTLAKAVDTPVDSFDPAKDQILGELRTSVFLEARIDPNNPGVPDYAPRAYEIGPRQTLDNFRELSVRRSDEETAAIPLELTGFDVEPGIAMTLRWSARFGQACEVQGSTDLLSWRPLATATTGIAKLGTMPASPAPASPDQGAVAVALPPEGMFGEYYLRVRKANRAP